MENLSFPIPESIRNEVLCFETQFNDIKKKISEKTEQMNSLLLAIRVLEAEYQVLDHKCTSLVKKHVPGLNSPRINVNFEKMEVKNIDINNFF